MTIEEAFGIVLRRMRKERLLSQDELSNISSLDRVFISRLERGKQQPTLVTIFELSSALGISATRIVTEVELLLWFHNVKGQFNKTDQLHLTYDKLWEYFGESFMASDLGTSCEETILLVEDEMHVQKFLADALESVGYKVILAVDGQEAVDKYRDNCAAVDLVLMDIMMPRKDGVTAHKEIMALNPAAKILMMSGYSAVSLGNIDDLNFIQKPMAPSMLFTNIRGILDSRHEMLLPVAGL
ncbi:MAG: response regulator [Desulfuromonadaceae bacterium]|nr:response regulator [Desulfuromonadaceae bacterium]